MATADAFTPGGQRKMRPLKVPPRTAHGYNRAWMGSFRRMGGAEMALKRKGQEYRQHIVQAANRLFYQRGYNQTSFSDIAEAAAVPRGNFYYYFKSKDEILEAVVDMRLQSIRDMLAQWDATLSDPRERLHRFVQILANEEQEILRYGCPLGSLNAELSKTQLQQQTHARQMFELFLQWLQSQFEALGQGLASRDLAWYLLSVTQGACLVSNAFEEQRLLRKQVERLQLWIETL